MRHLWGIYEERKPDKYLINSPTTRRNHHAAPGQPGGKSKEYYPNAKELSQGW